MSAALRIAARHALLAAALALAAGCASSAPGTNVDDEDVDAGGGDASDVPSIDAPPDERDADAAIDVRPDVAPDIAPDVPTGSEIGAACERDGDCATGRCVVLIGGDGVCTAPCATDASCPRDFDCVLIGADGGDGERVCLNAELCIDVDGDLHGVGPGCVARDCDDADPGRNLSASEVCDGRDNDCNDAVDDDPVDEGLRCDTGFAGVCARGVTLCGGGITDCVGETAASPEVCDNLDNDCDGAPDNGPEGGPLRRDCYDGDAALLGVGVCASGQQTCSAGGYSACLGQTLPSAELCDERDNDCDAAVDESLARVLYHPDGDADGFGDSAAVPADACARPAGFVENNGDCNDADRTVRPGAAEVPGDGADQNCDGAEFCFEDVDSDGFRPTSAAVVISLDIDCNAPGEAPASFPVGDCDDNRGDVNPDAAELCDRRDNDCNGRIDEGNGCYAVGEPCDSADDCATALCVDGRCERPITCVEAGTCPNRVAAVAGAARRVSPRFVLELSSPTGPVTPVLSSDRFRLTVGPHPYVTDP